MTRLCAKKHQNTERNNNKYDILWRDEELLAEADKMAATEKMDGLSLSTSFSADQVRKRNA